MVASVAPAASAIMTGAAQTSLKGEDLWKTHMQAIGGDMVSFAIVADGHGGVSAAQLCSERIVPYIIEEAHGDASASSLRKAGGAAFERVHKEVRAAGATDGVFPGTTLTVCMINVARNELTTLHVGDSEAILVPHEREDALPQRLTAEHRLQDSRPEQKRVVNLGGKVGRLQHPETKLPAGPLRVFPGGLACARGIGDADAGDVVSAVPACSTVPLKGFARGWDCIVGSDGIWDAMQAASVVRICRGHPHTVTPQRLAELLVEQAIAKRHAFDNVRTPRDDTTCIVMRCHGPLSERGGCANGKVCVRDCELPSLVAEPVEFDAIFVEDSLRPPPIDENETSTRRSSDPTSPQTPATARVMAPESSLDIEELSRDTSTVSVE